MSFMQKTRIILSYNNYFYHGALQWESKSCDLFKNKKFIASFALSTAARLPYLVDIIVNIAMVPITIIGMLYGFIHAIVTSNYQLNITEQCWFKLQEKIQHLFFSTIGAGISPWIAYRLEALLH